MTQTIEIEGKTYNVVVTDGKPELVEAKQKLKPGTYRVGDVLDQLSVGDKIRIDAEITCLEDSRLPIEILPVGFDRLADFGTPWIDRNTLITIPGETDEITVNQAIKEGLKLGDELWIKVTVDDMDSSSLPLCLESKEGEFSEIWAGRNAIVKVVRK